MNFEDYKELVSTKKVEANLKAHLPGGKLFKNDQEVLKNLTEYCQWLAHHAVSAYCGQTPNEPFKAV